MEQEKLDFFGLLTYKIYCFPHNVNERKIMQLLLHGQMKLLL